MRRTFTMAALMIATVASTTVFAGPTTREAQPHARQEQRHQPAARGDGFRQLRETVSKLELSEDQKKQVEQIIASTRTELQGVREAAKNGGDKEQVRQQTQSIMRNAQLQLAELLTPEQKQKFRQIKAQARDARKAQRSDKAGPTTRPQ